MSRAQKWVVVTPPLRTSTVMLRVWRLMVGRCIRCGKQPGDEARFGWITSVTDGWCDQCSTWGES